MAGESAARRGASSWSSSTRRRGVRIALRYAARRAAHTGGRVAMLHVMEPTELQHFMAVEELMSEERREAAEALLQKLVRRGDAAVRHDADRLYLAKGDRRDELLELINEEPAHLHPGAGAPAPAPRGRGR